MRRGLCNASLGIDLLSSRPISNAATCSYSDLSPLLERCSTLRQAGQIHAHFVSLGLVRYTYVTSRILATYALHDMRRARRLFDRIPHPTIFNWNTMIRGYSRSPRPETGTYMYVWLRRRAVAPNMHTFPCVIKSCACLRSLFQVHAQALRFGLDLDVFVTSSLVKSYCSLGSVELASKVFDESSNKNVVCWTSLISGCCGCGQVDRAREVFDMMPEKNDVSWSAMITGYVQNERHEEAIGLFRRLRSAERAELNGSLLVSVLNACSSMGAVEDGRWIRSYADRKGLEYGLELGTALMDFYAKCGLIESAKDVFCKMSRKDVTAWSAMVMGLALNGHSYTAIEVFTEMLSQKVAPNAITFVGVLTACNHGGLVDQGRAYFTDMNSIYGISPTIEHYGCMVDLLSRAGHVVEAMRLIESMPVQPDAAIWGALLNGCLMHGHVELGEKVGRLVTELEPGHCGRYVSLANVYASMERWESAVQVRRAMREKGVRTTAGWSLMELNGVGHRFLADDRGHPLQKEIYRMMCDLNLELVSPDTGTTLDEFPYT